MQFAASRGIGSTVACRVIGPVLGRRATIVIVFPIVQGHLCSWRETGLQTRHSSATRSLFTAMLPRLFRARTVVCGSL